MRKQMTVLVALLALAACGQFGQQAPAESRSAQRPAEDVISGRSAADWVILRNGEFANDSFVLQQSGTAFVGNREAPVSAGDLYTGEITIVAQSAGSVAVRVTNGCGTRQNDAGLVVYDVAAGENTLIAHHKFARPANCAHLSVTAETPITYTLSSARLTRTP